jgi:TPR repeat protein
MWIRTSSNMVKYGAAALVVIGLSGVSASRPASADPMASATAAYDRRDYARAATLLTPLALHGNAKAQAMLGFMYQHGFGEPQVYVAAVDLYRRAANSGDAFAQCMLGLMYDKGYGVDEDFVLAYKWLNLAVALASPRQRDYYLRLRDAVASKMSTAQIAEGQRLALLWVPVRP